MEYTQLGRSGLSVSRLCLGTLNFGPYTPAPDAFRIMEAAHENGINFFDTANVYGQDKGKGATETIIGDWFAQGQGRRERTVLATKLFGEMPLPGAKESEPGWPNTGRLSALNIRRSLDASLRRLQTDYIDLYQFHTVDLLSPWEEVWQALEVAVQQGKILYVGSSNFGGWHIAAAQEAARARHFTGLASEQSIYNLVTRIIELEVIPAVERYGLGLLPWSPLNGGLLGGVLKQDREGTRRLAGRAAAAMEKHGEAIQAYEDLADRIDQPPATVALAWLLHQPVVTAPIIGPRTVDQLLAAVGALEVSLDADVLGKLDEIFPGYRPAPQHYAW